MAGRGSVIAAFPVRSGRRLACGLPSSADYDISYVVSVLSCSDKRDMDNAVGDRTESCGNRNEKAMAEYIVKEKSRGRFLTLQKALACAKADAACMETGEPLCIVEQSMLHSTE